MRRVPQFCPILSYHFLSPIVVMLSHPSRLCLMFAHYRGPVLSFGWRQASTLYEVSRSWPSPFLLFLMYVHIRLAASGDRNTCSTASPCSRHEDGLKPSASSRDAWQNRPMFDFVVGKRGPSQILSRSSLTNIFPSTKIIQWVLLSKPCAELGSSPNA
jgi:hypothetical protein